MRFAFVTWIGLVLAVAVHAGRGHAQDPDAHRPALVAPTDPLTPDNERKLLRLPPGFDIQLVAAEPDIHKPMNLAFDDRGRLWVTNSLEYPFPAKEGVTPRDTVKILEDFDENGRARKITTFADGLNIPIGVLPLSGGSEALVHGIPYIYRFIDIDGDGRADRREVAYGRYGSIDTHGMTNAFTWGFDGWIYACHGFSNTSTVQGADAQSITLSSGNVYRFKADGSHLEYFTHGQVNPFGLAFDPLGNLYSCDCHSKPIYQLLREAYYPSFGKPDDGLGFGPEMMAHDHGSTGIAGIVYYTADHFPPEYRDTIFIGNVVTNRINHDRLERHGSTYQAIEQPDFLVSDDPWFRPVDFELGPDGAIYVADFYNRIIGHYEVPLTHPGRDRERGRIWRIIYRGPDGQRKPVAPRSDWTSAAIDDLIHDLAHPNLTVRTKATNQLVWRGGLDAIQAVRAVMTPGSNVWQRVHGLWVLHRSGALDNEILASAAQDREAPVRVHAMRVLGEVIDLTAPRRALALAGLKDPDAFVRRAAAEALGRHPDPAHVRPLLDLRRSIAAADTLLLHAVRIALRDQLQADSAWQHLPSPLSERDARDIADVAPGVHTAVAADYLLNYIQKYEEHPETLAKYVHHIARYGKGDAADRLLSFVREHEADHRARQAMLIKAIHQGREERGQPLGDSAQAWASELARKLLASEKPDEISAGIDLAGTLKLASSQQALADLIVQPKAPEPERTAAITALVGMGSEKLIPILDRLLNDSSEPIGLRDRAAQALAQVNREESREVLLKALPTAPGRLQTTIAACLAITGKPGVEKLLDAVAAGKASPRLLQEPGVEIWLLQAKLPDLKDRVAKLTAGLPPADQRIQELLNRRRDGFGSAHADASRGAKVFEKQCANCHQIEGKGARVGPQLDGIGVRGLERLVEDILDPNRNIDQQFRATSLALKDGRVVSGLLLREEGQVLIVADSQGKELRIPVDTVEERSIASVSPMPANLADQIPENDFYDLIAYLLTKQPPRER
jgi:putative heme-binding domain-containing protein